MMKTQALVACVFYSAKYHRKLPLMKKKLSIIFILIILCGAIAYASIHPVLGRSPRGERLERMKATPTYYDGKFHNLSPTPLLTTKKSKFRTMFDFIFEKREGTKPEINIPTIKTDLKSLPNDSNILIWMGHSSYYLQLDGMKMLIDPVLYHAAPLSFVNKPFKNTSLYKAEDIPDIDYLIITHDHFDHLDHKAVKKLKNRISKVVCPLGVGEHFEYWGYQPEQLTELYWNEEGTLANDSKITCLPARHFSGRTFKRDQTLWASYMLETPSKTIYIGGDSGYDTHYKEIAGKFPEIDLALLENGQYNEDWRYIHHLPEDLIEVIKDLSPKSVFAGHNSRYALAKHPWNEPLEMVYQSAQENNLNLLTPIIGEKINLDEENSTTKWW